MKKIQYPNQILVYFLLLSRAKEQALSASQCLLLNSAASVLEESIY